MLVPRRRKSRRKFKRHCFVCPGEIKTYQVIVDKPILIKSDHGLVIIEKNSKLCGHCGHCYYELESAITTQDSEGQLS